MRNFFLVVAVLVSHVVALRTTIQTGVHQHRSLLSMAPPNQPQEPGPPKREPNPLVVPTVGLGNNQVIYVVVVINYFSTACFFLINRLLLHIYLYIQFDVISRLLKDRILLLGSEVNDEVANVMVSQMLYLASSDPTKDITIYINSPGKLLYPCERERISPWNNLLLLFLSLPLLYVAV